jgi:hypothetical protein
MSRKTSESVKLIEQAQFTVCTEKFDRANSYAENLFAHSNKFGILLVAKGNKLIACSVSEFEKDFQGGDEQEITENTIICTKPFESAVKYIALSPQADYVAVCCATTVYLYHMSIFANKVI